MPDTGTLAAAFLQRGEFDVRTLTLVVIFVVLLPVTIRDSPQRPLPTVVADVVQLSEVRRASELGVITGLGESGDVVVVERPLDATAGTSSSVFVVADDGALRRVPVTYGRASASLIQIVSGVSPGDRIVVSDMRAWDAFDRIRLRVQ